MKTLFTFFSVKSPGWILVVILSLLSAESAWSATITTTGSGNWSSTVPDAPWPLGTIPAVGDDIIIGDGFTLTVDSDRTSLSMTVGNGSTLTVNGTVTLTITNGLVFPNLATIPTTGFVNGVGTINAGSMSIGGNAVPTVDNVDPVITTTIRSLNVAGDLTLTALRSGTFDSRPIFQLQSGSVTLTGTLSCVTADNVNSTTLVTLNSGASTGTLVLGNTTAIATSGNQGVSTFTFNGAGATVNYSAAGAQTVQGVAYTNLTLSGSGAKALQTATTVIGGDLVLSGTATTTTVIGLTINGDLSIGDGTSFTIPAFGIIVNGTTTVGGGTSGSLIISSTPGGKRFDGLVTVNAGGTWNNSGNDVVVFRGGITNSGTFTAGTGVQTFNTSAIQALTGSFVIPSVTVNVPTVLTNNNDLTVNTALSGTGGLTQASNATLTIGGTSGITTLTATNSGNTVNYSGVAQTVKSTNFANLELSGSGVKTLAVGTTSITEDFTFSGTASATAVVGLTIGGSVTLGTGTTFIGGAFTHNVAADWINNGGTFTNAGSTINFDGAGPQAINGTAATQSFNNVVVNKGGGTVTVGGGTTTLNVSNFTQTLGNFTAPSTLNATGTVTLTAGTYTAGASTSVGADFTNNGGTFAAGAGILTFNGTTQTIGGSTSTTFNEVVTSGTTNTSIGVSTIIGGNLSILNGTTFTAAGFDLTVTGTTSVGSGASGNLTISSATGTKTFTGLVTVATGATWNNAGNSAVNFEGGITNTGSFTAGTGLHTFETNPQTLLGTFSISTVQSDIALTNTNILTVAGSLSGSGSLVQAAGATLNLGGSLSGISIDASGLNNTVNYSGTNQTIFPTSYEILAISQSTGQAIAGGDINVNETLALNTGNFNLIAANTLTLGASATITGAFSSTRMIIATAGSEVQKFFSGAVPFTFPVGDNTGSVEYSPIIITPTTGGTIGVSVVDAKHPNNASATFFLSRYWDVTTTGITGADIIGTYLDSDIIGGSEASIKAAQLDGTFDRLTNPWVKNLDLDAANNELEFTGAVLTGGQTSVFTGITKADPIVTITSAPDPYLICDGDSFTITTSLVGGDPTVTYLWTGAGLSASTIPNPVFTAAYVAGLPVTYQVDVTDGNGIVGTDQIQITVDALPTLTGAVQAVSVCDGFGAVIDLVGLLPGSTSTINYSINGVAQAPFAGVAANGGGAGSFITVNLSSVNDGQNLQITGITITSSVPNCSQSFTQNVTLSVDALAVIGTAPVAATGCEGSTVS
ncbi:MAG: hypothetical protein AABY93_07460, partial [Bacteroidota bacterium]